MVNGLPTKATVVDSTGAAGLTQLSQSSAGTTVTASYASYQPTPTPSATAGKFLVKYVVAGSCIAASVRQTVYDSRHPDIVLIPQGTRLLGLCTTPAAT
jgi:hypothetical protein